MGLHAPFCKFLGKRQRLTSTGLFLPSADARKALPATDDNAMLPEATFSL